MTNQTVCENYEITIGENGAGVVLTFDLDDVRDSAPEGLGYVKSLEIDQKGFHVGLAADPAADEAIKVVFPMQEGMDEIVQEIRTTYGSLIVAALGEGDEPGTSAVIFAREMLLG